jgi:voltage-gated potassium channel
LTGSPEEQSEEPPIPSPTPARAAPTAGLGMLSPGRRRLVITAAIVRTALSVAVLVVIYFVVPMGRAYGLTSVIFLVGGLIIVAVVLAIQIRATMRSPHPALRAVESLGVTVPLLLLLFSATHYLLEMTVSQSYTQPLTRLDALYFSVTMFSTVGFGDIAPVTQAARVITLVQMLVNVGFLGVVARVLFGAAIGGRRDRSGQSSTS